VALRYLINNTKQHHLVVTLDSEQCLTCSPFIHNCLKELLHQRYLNDYYEQRLPLTWRCPPGVATVANHLMNAKYDRFGNKERRVYSNIESAQAEGGGVSFVGGDVLPLLKPYGASPKTVVLMKQTPSAEERRQIYEQLGTYNILSFEEAIGLDFDIVILWKPFSSLPQSDDERLALHNILNGWYVGITRAQKAVFIYQTKQDRKRWKSLEIELLGPTVLHNHIAVDMIVDAPEKARALWELQIKYHLDEGHEEAARQLMRGYLNMSETQIDQRIKPMGVQSQNAVSLNTNYKKEKTAEASLKSTKETQKKTTPQVVQKELALPSSHPNEQKFSEQKAPSQNAAALEYVQKFLIQMSETKLDTLSKNKQFISYLFLQVESGACIFTKILSNGYLTDMLVDKLFQSNHLEQIQSYLTPTFLNQAFEETTPLIRLLIKPSGQRLLQALVGWESGVDEHILSRMIPVDVLKREAMSALHLMLVSSHEYKMPLEILLQNHQVRNNITPSALYGSSSSNQTAFYLLTTEPQGIKILECILEDNPQLIHSLPLAVLCGTEEASPLQSMAFHQAIPLFSLLRVHQPDLVFNLLHLCDDFLRLFLNKEILNNSYGWLVLDDHHEIRTSVLALFNHMPPSMSLTRPEVLMNLAKKGLDFNKRMLSDGVTPAFIAAQERNVDALRLFAERPEIFKVDFNKAVETGATPVFEATGYGHIEVLRLFAERPKIFNVDFNKAKKDGATPAFIAAQMGSIEVLRLFAELSEIVKIDYNKAMNDGATPVFIATQLGHIEVLRLFAELPEIFKIDFHSKNRHGMTLAFLAAVQGHKPVIALLKSLNVDFSLSLESVVSDLKELATKKGLDVIGNMDEFLKGKEEDASVLITPIEIARVMGHQEIVDMLEDHTILPTGTNSTFRFFSRKSPEDAFEDQVIKVIAEDGMAP
jgi:ankyrin repeat protein